ncbi:MAG: Fic family protein [Nitrospirae bacterium]|nr:Fic family protein [Nitrospirota bacterium]
MKPYIPDKLPLTTGVKLEALIPSISLANRAIAKYEGILYRMPNPDILLNPLSKQEAVLSSRIEGTQVTLGEVFNYEAEKHSIKQLDKQDEYIEDIKEVLNYHMALHRAKLELKKRPFNLNLLCELHRILLNSVRGKDKGRGRFRTVQNYIGKLGTPIEQADYVPPDHMLVMDFLDNWEKFYHADYPDPLVQLAIIHAQFELIHPFIDGNGRIGRILIPIFLFEKNLTTQPVFYLSEYLERHRDGYISGLNTICRTEAGWNDWIRFFLNAIVAQSEWNVVKAQKIIALYEELKERIISQTHSQYAVPLLDQMYNKPVFKSTQIKIPGVTRQTTTGLLRSLKDNGILDIVREASGSRPQLLSLTSLIKLL